MRNVLIMFYATMFSFMNLANATTSDDEKLTHEEQQQVKKIAHALQFYFEEIGQFDQDGNYQLTDMEALRELMTQGDPLAQKVYELYFNGVFEIGTDNAVDFAKCVAGKFADSYGSVARAFLKGEIFDLLKKKDWGKAANLMFKVLRTAGKSASAASLAVEAGIYGWQCRNKW